MLMVVGEVRIKPEDLIAVKDAIHTMVTATRREEGCITYSFAEDLVEPGLVRICERWINEDALNAHFQTDHMAAFNKVLGSIEVQGMQIAIYDALNERSM